MRPRAAPRAALGALRGAPSAPAVDHAEGGAVWDFVSAFLAARRAFLSIYGRYEERVHLAAEERGVARANLRLPPRELSALFHLPRLEALRDDRIGPLKALADEVFGEHHDQELMDVYCSHLFHECAILCEEHRSVRRFVRIQDRRRYAQLFQEVSRYYPVRLRRMVRFFAAGLKRLESLLPEWAHLRVVVRSVFLFGERLARATWGQGIEALYRRMYPDGGAPEGYATAAASFEASGFLPQAREAAALALDAPGPSAQGRDTKASRAARREAAAIQARLGPAGSPAPTPPPGGRSPR